MQLHYPLIIDYWSVRLRDVSNPRWISVPFFVDICGSHAAGTRIILQYANYLCIFSITIWFLTVTLFLWIRASLFKIFVPVHQGILDSKFTNSIMRPSAATSVILFWFINREDSCFRRTLLKRLWLNSAPTCSSKSNRSLRIKIAEHWANQNDYIYLIPPYCISTVRQL